MKSMLLAILVAGSVMADSGLAAIWGIVLVIDPINRSAIYVVAGGNGGVRKSTDGGNSWRMANAGLPHAFAVTTCAIDPQSPGTLYAAGIRPDAMVKCLDGGAGWNEAGAGLLLTSGGLASAGLTIDPRSLATVYLTSSSGIFKSVDGRSSSTAASSGIRLANGNQCRLLPVVINRQNPNALFAASCGGEMYSDQRMGVREYSTALGSPK